MPQVISVSMAKTYQVYSCRKC